MQQSFNLGLGNSFSASTDKRSKSWVVGYYFGVLRSYKAYQSCNTRIPFSLAHYRHNVVNLHLNRPSLLLMRQNCEILVFQLCLSPKYLA